MDTNQNNIHNSDIDLVLSLTKFNQKTGYEDFGQLLNASEIIDKMIQLDILKYVGINQVELTAHGHQIKNIGSYTSYLNEIESKRLKEAAEFSNLEIQLKLNKHQYKSRWIAYISLFISIIAILISVLDLKK